MMTGIVTTRDARRRLVTAIESRTVVARSNRASATHWLADYSAIFLFTAMIVLPQSFFEFRAALLVLFLLVHGLIAMNRVRLNISISDLTFYIMVAVVGLLWGLIGLLNANSVNGIMAYLKLYVLWGMLFLLIVTLHRNSGRLELLHRVFVLSTVCIFVINAIAMADAVFELGILGPRYVEELELGVGLDHGVIRFNANNIASLFFLLGYLIAYKFTIDRKDRSETWVNIALALGLLVAALSGRRALWIAVLLMPAVVIAVATASGMVKRLRWRGNIVACWYLAAAVCALIALFLTSDLLSDIVEHVQTAFGAEDQRSIQMSFLLAAFERQPLLGSGFGGYAGYLRSGASPWQYELTYHQMLFNFGIVGCVLLGSIFVYYFSAACVSIRRFPEQAPMRFGILVGFLCFLIGTYSNPYLQFFDSMIFIMFFVSLTAGGALRKVRRRVRA